MVTIARDHSCARKFTAEHALKPLEGYGGTPRDKDNAEGRDSLRGLAKKRGAPRPIRSRNKEAPRFDGGAQESRLDATRGQRRRCSAGPRERHAEVRAQQRALRATNSADAVSPARQSTRTKKELSWRSRRTRHCGRARPRPLCSSRRRPSQVTKRRPAGPDRDQGAPELPHDAWSEAAAWGADDVDDLIQAREREAGRAENKPAGACRRPAESPPAALFGKALAAGARPQRSKWGTPMKHACLHHAGVVVLLPATHRRSRKSVIAPAI